MAFEKVEQSETTLVLERVFAAPRDLVFRAYSDSNEIAKWWGPKDWTTPVSKMDFRVGGEWHYCMKGPDDGSEWANVESWGIAEYIEIDPPKKIVYRDYFSDAEGTKNPDMPPSTATVEFQDEGDKTRLIMTCEFDSPEGLQEVIKMGMVEGCDSMFDDFDKYLEQVQS